MLKCYNQIRSKNENSFTMWRMLRKVAAIPSRLNAAELVRKTYAEWDKFNERQKNDTTNKYNKRV